MNKLKSRMASTFLLYDKRNEAMNTLCLKFFVSLVLFVKSIISASSEAPVMYGCPLILNSSAMVSPWPNS